MVLQTEIKMSTVDIKLKTLLYMYIHTYLYINNHINSYICCSSMVRRPPKLLQEPQHITEENPPAVYGSSLVCIKQTNPKRPGDPIALQAHKRASL